MPRNLFGSSITSSSVAERIRELEREARERDRAAYNHSFQEAIAEMQRTQMQRIYDRMATDMFQPVQFDISSPSMEEGYAEDPRDALVTFDDLYPDPQIAETIVRYKLTKRGLRRA